MSLLSLFTNIVWRGNAAAESAKRAVAARLISGNNEPQNIQQISGLAPLGLDVVGFAAILSSDPCFQLDHASAAVCLNLDKLTQIAKATLSTWVDQAIPPSTPTDFLKHCLAKHIVNEQEALINVSSSTLFTIDRNGADAMLDAFWTDDHPWRGTISPAYHSVEAIFSGDTLWSVQPGGSIKLNVSALLQRAGSPRVDERQPSDHSPQAAGGDAAPQLPVAASLWSGNSNAPVTGLAGPVPSGPPPSMLPSPSLFAAASHEQSGRPTAAAGPEDTAGAAPGSAATGFSFGAGTHGNILDLNLGSHVSGFGQGLGQGLGLRWPPQERGADAEPGPAAAGKADLLALGASGADSASPHASRFVGNLFDYEEAAVEEVAENVALEALGDSVAAPAGGDAAAPGKRVAAAGALAGGGQHAGTGLFAGGASAAFGGGRGWELFPSAALGGGGRNAADGQAAAGGAGDRGDTGNMSLLDELYMAFAPSGGGAATGGNNAFAASPRSAGGTDIRPLGGPGSGQWGAPWSSAIGEQHPKTSEAGQHATNGRSLLGGGQFQQPAAPLPSNEANGLASPNSPKPPALPSFLQGFGMPPLGESQGGLFAQGAGAGAASAPAPSLPSFAPPPGPGLGGFPVGGGRAPAAAQPSQAWEDPAILNAGSAHPVSQGPGPGGAIGSSGAVAGSSLLPPDRERAREPRVVPFQPPPPPLSLTRGALALANVGPPAVLPAAAMHGFDVAAAAAAAAGRGLGAQAPGALGMMPAAAPNGAGAGPFAPPGFHQSPPQQQQQQLLGDGSLGREGMAAPSAASGSPDMAGNAPNLRTAADYAATAARVWPGDAPKNVVRRVAATLLALHGQGSATEQHSMPWEPLLMAVRRQDPVACNKAGDLLAVLDEDPCGCLSVIEAEGGGSEVVCLDLPRMMELAGPPPAPPIAQLYPTAPPARPPPQPLQRRTSLGASSTASTPREPIPVGGPAAPNAFLQPAGRAAALAAAAGADPSRRRPLPSALPGGWPAGAAPFGASGQAPAATQQNPAGPQQHAYAAAAAAAAAMQAMQAAHSQARPQQGSLLAGAPNAPGAVTSQALLMQLLQQQQQQGLMGAGGPDSATLMQLLQAQQLQQQQQQLRLAQQAQQAQQAQHLHALLQRQAVAQHAQHTQQLLQKQQMQQLQQLMLLEQRRQQQAAAQAQAQAQLAPMIPVLPVPPTSQTAALANLLQQYSAASANQASSGAARQAVAPLPLAALPNAGNLLNASGPVGPSQSHANVAAWLAAHAQSRGATPPPLRGSQQGDGADAGAASQEQQQRQQLLQAFLASVPQSASQQQRLMEMLGAQPDRQGDGAGVAEEGADVTLAGAVREPEGQLEQDAKAEGAAAVPTHQVPGEECSAVHETAEPPLALLPSLQFGLGSTGNQAEAAAAETASVAEQEAAQATGSKVPSQETVAADAAGDVGAAVDGAVLAEAEVPAPAAGTVQSAEAIEAPQTLPSDLLASTTTAPIGVAPFAFGASDTAPARSGSSALAGAQPAPARTPVLRPISPAHLLRAFPGLDTRAHALRTIAQVLLHSRHPHLGPAATDPGLLLLVLRQKGIFGAASDAASLALLTSLLLSEPRFFTIVPPTPAGDAAADGAADAAGGLGGGAAVQLRVEELQALMPPEGQDGEVESEAEAREITAAGGVVEARAGAEPGLAAAAQVPGGDAAVPSPTVVTAAPAAAAPETGAAASPDAESVTAVLASAADEVAAPGASRSPEGEGDGEEEQSDEAHLAMLMRLLATGARLEEDPLPDSPAQLQRQLSPLLQQAPPPPMVAAPVPAASAAGLDSAGQEPGSVSAEPPAEPEPSSMLVIPVPIPVPVPVPTVSPAEAAAVAPVLDSTADVPQPQLVAAGASDAGDVPSAQPVAVEAEEMQPTGDNIRGDVAAAAEQAASHDEAALQATSLPGPGDAAQSAADAGEPAAPDTCSTIAAAADSVEEKQPLVPSPVIIADAEPQPPVDEAPPIDAVAAPQPDGSAIDGVKAADIPDAAVAAPSPAEDADAVSTAALATTVPEEAPVAEAAAPAAPPAAAPAAAGAGPGPSPSAAHLQPAAVRYISGLDVEAGCGEEVAALAALTQHCAAAGRVVVDCAVAELQLETEPAAGGGGALLPAAAGGEGAVDAEPACGAVAAAGSRTSPVLLAVLAPAAQSWPTTLYVLGVAGVPPGSQLVRAAAALLAGPGSAVKVVWNAAQVLPALAPLLPDGGRVAPTQDLRALVSLATGGAAAAAGSEAHAPADSFVGAAAGAAAAASGGTPRAPAARPWSGMVALQERLAQLGVAGRDLASLAALGADAWVVHPLSCVVEAAAARQLCGVLEARRSLLAGEGALLDALLCAVTERLADAA